MGCNYLWNASFFEPCVRKLELPCDVAVGLPTATACQDLDVRQKVFDRKYLDIQFVLLCLCDACVCRFTKAHISTYLEDNGFQDGYYDATIFLMSCWPKEFRILI